MRDQGAVSVDSTHLFRSGAVQGRFSASCIAGNCCVRRFNPKHDPRRAVRFSKSAFRRLLSSWPAARLRRIGVLKKILSYRIMTFIMDKAFSPASERNGPPILAVLKDAFADCRRVLEIGSGTGQHAVYFGARLPHLVWQTSDLPDNHPS